MEEETMTTPPADDRQPDVAHDPDFGGASAGAQDGGIVDTGEADDETPYADALAGREPAPEEEPR